MSRYDPKTHAEMERLADRDYRSANYHRLPRPVRWRCPDCGGFRRVEDAGPDCDPCRKCGATCKARKIRMTQQTSTERVRKYRSDPAKRAKDNARARRWKRENRERMLAYMREYNKQPGRRH